MRSIVEKLKTALQSYLISEDVELEFIKTRKSILRELATAKDTGTVIGINSPALGEGMFITAVEDIYRAEGGDVIHLKPYAMSGHILPRTQLSLMEIKSVCPFKAAYRNPVFA